MVEPVEYTRQKWYRLLGMLQSYAPNAAAQQKCANMVTSAQLGGATDKEVELMIVEALHDGLRHGNWLWDL